MQGFRIALSLCLAALPALPALGQTVDNRKEYGACMDLARRAPEQGFEKATAWQGLGGGEAAKHCAAVALIGLKHYPDAAERLEALARESRSEPGLRAAILAQAGQAWLMAGQAERAAGAAGAALKLTPEDPELFLDRAIALESAGKTREALADLDRAIALAPNRPEAYVLRAGAKRKAGDLAGALADAEAAIGASFGNFPEAFLERGHIRRARNDIQGAKQDWLKAVQLAPKTPTADSAQEAIQALEAK